MLKSIIVPMSLLFVVVSAFAQQPTRSNSVSVFVSDISGGSSRNGTSFNADFGAALDHMFSRHVSAEVSVTSQRSNSSFTTLSPSGVPTTIFHSDRLYPVDATVSYHFLTDSRWKPYIGGGVRYVSDTVSGSGPLGGYRLSRHSTEPEVSGGITFQFNPRLGLRFDAKQVANNDHSIITDANFKASVGLSLRF